LLTEKIFIDETEFNFCSAAACVMKAQIDEGLEIISEVLKIADEETN